METKNQYSAKDINISNLGNFWSCLSAVLMRIHLALNKIKIGHLKRREAWINYAYIPVFDTWKKKSYLEKHKNFFRYFQRSRGIIE